MNSFDSKVEIAMGYIDAIYRIEKMRADGIFGMYALEQQRIKKHEELCEIMMLGREQTVDICLFLDESIGFNLGELNSDYDYYREKYAKRLVRKLGMIQIINNTHSNKEVKLLMNKVLMSKLSLF